MARRGTRGAWALAAAGCLLLLLSACATTTTVSRTGPSSGPYPTPPPLSDPTGRAGDPDPALVLAGALSEQEAARDAVEFGEMEAARIHYETALARLDALGELHDPSLEACWEEILGEYRLLDLDAIARGEDAAGEPHEVTAKESLALYPLMPPDVRQPQPQPPAAPEPGPGGYTIPVPDNEVVQRYVELFSGSRKEIVAKGLRRSTAYLPMIYEVLEEEGLPRDLAWIPLVESNFKWSALSRAGAKGIWQFIPGTGRKYGLRIDGWVDERSDPEKATRAAAAYLKDLHGMFGDWELAMASYNAGEGRVGRQLRRTGSTTFWELRNHRYALRQETRGYVPAIQAAVIIGNNQAAYGFDLVGNPPWTFDRVVVESQTDLRVLAECAGTTVDEIRELNPELRRWTTPPGVQNYSLRVPVRRGEAFRVAYAAVPHDQRILFVEHRVRSGDTLWKIARQYGVSTREIASMNGIPNPNRLRVGQVLRISRGGGGLPPVQVASAHGGSSKKSTTHVVQRGETLHSIARRYGTTTQALVAQNGLSSANRIYAGQRLRVAPGQKGSAGGSKTVVYRVRTGDTLYAIARNHGTSVSNLRRWNGLSGNYIRPGQRLRLHL